MAFRLMPARPLAQEMNRLLDREISAATSGLTQGSRADRADRLDRTRKHIKKARALLRLARRTLAGRYDAADDALRTANRALGPLTDAHRSLQTLAAVRRAGLVRLAPATVSTLGVRMEARAAALEHDATLDDIRGRVVRLLESVRQQVGAADLRGLDRAEIVAAIREAHAAARHARRRAIKHPSVDRFHDWRKRTKREWYLVRLVRELTGNHLRDERHQLGALDACLGELHDTEVLMRALSASAPLSRVQMARVIRALRAQARDLRHQARRLSAVLDERPEQLARRVRRLWGSAPRRRAAATVRRWQRSA